MKKTIRVTAKKVDDAISQGLEILGVSIVDAEVRVISEGGFLKKAEVEITVGEDDALIPDVSEPVEEKPRIKVEAVLPKTEKPAEKKGSERLPKSKKENAPQSAPQPEKPVSSPIAPQPEKPRSLFDKFGGKAAQTGGGAGQKPQENKHPSGGQENGKKPREDKKPPFEKKQRPLPRESAPATEETLRAAEAFVSKILLLSNIGGTVCAKAKDGVLLTVETEDSAVIGHRGETLDALQHLIMQIINAGDGKFVSVSVDAMGYRARRSETLRRMAQKAAEKCIAQNRRVSLDSMNNSDRKEVHAYLSENDRVVTRSEGTEPNRRIVIYPAK